MVTVPETGPAEVGSNRRVSVAVCPGGIVTADVGLTMLKPGPPEMDTPVAVTGAVPVEVKATVCIEGELRVTLPNATEADCGVTSGVPPVRALRLIV